MIKSFWIVRPPQIVFLQRFISFLIHSGGQIGRADFAPDFALAEFVVVREDDAEMVERVLQTFLRARVASELEVSIRLARVNLDGAFEALSGFFELAALLMDQAELIMRFGITFVDRAGFQVSAKTLPL